MITQQNQWMSFEDYLALEDQAEHKHEYEEGYLIEGVELRAARR